jgi:hypothetical protein
LPRSSKAEQRALGDHESRTPVRLPKRRQSKLPTRRKVDALDVVPDHVVSDKGQQARALLYGGANNEYREMNRSWTLTWLRHRMREYVNIHGYASSGVCALLERAAEQYADSDYLRATAASKGDPDPTSLKQASQHAANARSHELAAWELAAREGVMRRQLGEQDEKVSKLARELNKETTNSEPMTWDGGLTGELVDAGAIEGLPSPFAKPGPASTLPPAQGGRSSGPLLPADMPKTIPPPLYLYCQPCSRNFRTRGGTRHCTRCGVEAQSDDPLPDLGPPSPQEPKVPYYPSDSPDPLPESGSPGIIVEREPNLPIFSAPQAPEGSK